MSDAHHDDEGAPDEEAHGHNAHGDDPNAGVVMGTPPTPAWVLTAVVIGLVTLAATVILAIALGGAPGESNPQDDHTPGNTTMEQTDH